MTRTTLQPEVGQVRREQALAALCRQRGEFLAFLRRRTPSGTDVEDVLQRALLLAVQKLDQLQQLERVTSWFYTILRRALADERDARQQRGLALEQLAAEAPLSTTASAVRCSCSLLIAESLAPHYAELLRRIDIEEEERAAVASSLGMSRGNVAVRLHRARVALRARLASTCGTTSAARCLDCNCGECAVSGPI
jgi:RNA polymerase sigma-70 factor, ECF subfamily